MLKQMMTQTKYLPCTLSDIRIGAVVYFRSHVSREPTLQNPLTYTKVVINDTETFKDVYEWVIDSPNHVCVPALSHEDIIGEGWKESDHFPKEKFRIYSIETDTDIFYLEWHYDNNEITIIQKIQYDLILIDRFNGQIRALPEFRDLMRVLGIKSDQHV